MRRFLLSTVALAGVYLAALGTTDVVDVVIGLVLGAGTLWVGQDVVFNREPPHGPPLWRRLVALPGFLWRVNLDVLYGVWIVTLAIFKRVPDARSGVVAVPFDERSPEAVGLSGLVATLSPGEVLIDVDWERDLMYLHVLDADDPDAVRAAHRRLYQKHQRKVLP